MKEFGRDNYISNLSIDCVIFGYEEKALKVLISKSRFGTDIWDLPGGYIKKNEGIDKAASRILKERTSLENIYLEQFRVFGDESRIIDSKFRDLLLTEMSQKYNIADAEWITSNLSALVFMPW